MQRPFFYRIVHSSFILHNKIKRFQVGRLFSLHTNALNLVLNFQFRWNGIKAKQNRTETKEKKQIHERINEERRNQVRPLLQLFAFRWIFHSVSDAELWESVIKPEMYLCCVYNTFYVKYCVYKTTSNQLDLVIWKMKYTQSFTFTDTDT